MQHRGCKILHSLALEPEHQAAIVLAGGVETVVSNAMRKHLNHKGLQEDACETLIDRCHTLDSDAKAGAAKSGCVDAVLMAMRTHTDHEGVQEQGCRALH